MAEIRLLTVHLLGTFRIAADGREMESFNHARLQELVAYLLMQCGAPVSRLHLAVLLWSDTTEQQARTHLRRVLHHFCRQELLI